MHGDSLKTHPNQLNNSYEQKKQLMKIALFSDVHANLPAFEAVLADMDAKKPDQIYCLGDLVSYALYPNEVIEIIRSRQIPTIMGNHDEFIGQSPDDNSYIIDPNQKDSTISKAYTNQVLTSNNRAYLRQLPRHLTLDFQIGEASVRFLMVHGSPRKINEYLLEDHVEKDFIDLFQSHQVGIMAFGHTHKPFHRVLNTQKGQYFHAINTGSVGKPKDGDPRACYVLITLTDESSLSAPDSIKVEFIRVPYEVEKMAQEIEQSPMPNAYADMLRKAY